MPGLVGRTSSWVVISTNTPRLILGMPLVLSKVPKGGYSVLGYQQATLQLEMKCCRQDFVVNSHFIQCHLNKNKFSCSGKDTRC